MKTSINTVSFRILTQLRFAFLAFFVLWFLVYINSGNHIPISGNLFFLRKYSSSIPTEGPVRHRKPCSGRYIYIHDIPRRLNNEILVNDCRNLLKWPESDMCQAILNRGLGPQLVKSDENETVLVESKSWFVTHPNLLEVIFHNRMKQYECLTNDSSLASAIYVPFYAGLDVGRYLWGFNSSVRDSGPIDLFKWLLTKPEWKFMWGRDHFFVVGRTTWDFRSQNEWGNHLMFLPGVKNVTVLPIESCPWADNEVAIPYPTDFHPSSDNQVIEWQSKVRKHKRTHLFSFVGALRPNQKDSIRGEIINQCLVASKNCKWFNCRSFGANCDDASYVIKTFLNSTFCLQPRGDTPTRRSTFDSILAGCIPVFFSEETAYTQYLWHLRKDHSKYSVLIPENDIKSGKASIDKTLSEISEEEVVKMREEVVRLIPNVMYANPSSKLESFQDAFDISVKGVLERVQKIRNGAKVTDAFFF